jgi:hypothetical protein
MLLESLIVPLLMDDSKYNSTIDSAQNKSNSLAKGLSNIGGTIVTGGIALAGTAIAGMTAYLVNAAKGAGDASLIQAQLNSVIESTGGKAGMTADSVNSLAGSLSKVTMYEDDVIVSAENMILTFTNIGKNIFPETTEMALNMSTALGQDLQSSSIQLGKALNDPIKGIGALSKVGVTFTQGQKDLIESLMKAGKIEEAQKVILAELNTEFGNSAKAAGKTFPGQLEILKNSFGNISDTIGGALLPILSKVVGKFADFVNSDQVQGWIAELVNNITLFAGEVEKFIPKAISFFEKIPTWFKDNQPIIVGILAALGVAVLAFGITVAAAAWAAIAPLLPVIAVMVVIGAAVALLYTAWTENWGGIRDRVNEVWLVIQPIFNELVLWFQTNIPIAIGILSGFWTTVLLPAIQSVFAWIVGIVFPIILELIAWLQINIPIALQALSNFWTNTLLPAIQAVWNWVQTVAFPIILELIAWLQTNIPIALQALSDFWNNVLLPAITDVWSFIETSLFPLFKSVAEFIAAAFTLAFSALVIFFNEKLVPALKVAYEWFNDNILPVLKTVAEWVGGKVSSAFNTLKDIIGWVTDKVKLLTDAIKLIKLPKALTPGSPTPFELGLRGIGKELKTLSAISLPQFTASVNMSGSVSDTGTQAFNFPQQSSNQLDAETIRLIVRDTVTLVMG